MADDSKLVSARTAAQMVLAKAQEILAKSETLHKYETENKAAPSKPKADKAQALERDYNDFETKKQDSKEKDHRQAKQVSPSGNPKEEAEGNNKPDGMEPDYEFKNKVSKELAKEKAAHMVKGEDPLSSVAGDRMKRAGGYKERGDKLSEKIAKEGAKDSHKERLEGIKNAPKPKLGKNENPDEKADAQLGEKVEHDVEEHMMENKDAEQKEGHKIMDKPEDKKSEQMEGDKAFIPARLIASAKLSKFMEHMHAKRKAKEAQAAGNQSVDAPAPGATMGNKPIEKAETGHEKGVHVKSKNYAQGSEAGNKIKTWPKGKGQGYDKSPIIGQLTDKAHEESKEAHKKVLGEIKSIKPKLPG
jgi:hypothetical protein